MSCRSCGSTHVKEVPSEVNLHPPHGRKYLDVPSVFAYPPLKVCMECGFTEFKLNEDELQRFNEVWHTYGVGGGENSHLTAGLC